jgi:hypothetical protein
VLPQHRALTELAGADTWSRQGWKPGRVKARPSGGDFSEADSPVPEGEMPVQTCWQKLHAQRASRMRVGVIRTGARLSIRTDAGAIEPWLDVAAFPDSPAGAFGVALSAIVSAFRVLRPIQRQALAYKPFAEVGGTDRTGRNRPAVWIEAEGRAVYRTPGDERVKVVCCLRTTTILQTVIAAA